MSSEVTVEGGHSTQPEITKHNAIPLEGQELKEALKKQIEYYFSKENLVTDRYLVSQMNSETFVPVKVIANFKQIKNLTTDLELLTLVMKECQGVELDSSSQMIKPSIKPTRNTLILREIPSTTPLQEVKAIFETEGHGKVSEIKPEIGDMWYVTFESDKGALASLDKLRNQTFQEKPIRCRLKTESTFRSISLSATNIPMPVPIEANTQNYVQGIFYPGAKSNDANKKGRGGSVVTTGGRKSVSGTASGATTVGKKGSKGPKTAAEVAAPRKRSTSKVELGVNNFPPLPLGADAKQSGYTESFQKWERQDFLDVLEGGENPKPAGLKEDSKESATVILSEPNKELEITKPPTKRSDSKSAWGSELHSIEKVMSPPKPTSNSKVTVSLTPAANAQASSSHPQETSPTKPKQNEEKKQEEPAQKPKENNSNTTTSTGPAAGTWASVLTSNKVADRT